jgi:hypothetical protein
MSTIQIPEAALDEMDVVGRGFYLFVREEERLDVQASYASKKFVAVKVVEPMVTVPSNWFRRVAWRHMKMKVKNPPRWAGDTVMRQAFGREDNQLMLTREGWNANAMRFKASFEKFVESENGKRYFANINCPVPTWAEVDKWANIKFDEVDRVTAEYIKRKLTPIQP